MKPVRILWLVVALQALFLLTWAGYHEFVLSTSPTVRLEVLPVDPRDLLRGDYMTLNYAISRHAVPADWPGGHVEVLVALRPDGDVHVIDEVLFAPDPPAGDQRVWVRAQASLPVNFAGAEAQLRLTYGIERFFVPEGRGTPRFDRMVVEASVSPTQRLHIRRAWLDGQPFP